MTECKQADKIVKEQVDNSLKDNVGCQFVFSGIISGSSVTYIEKREKIFQVEIFPEIKPQKILLPGHLAE